MDEVVSKQTVVSAKKLKKELIKELKRRIVGHQKIVERYEGSGLSDVGDHASFLEEAHNNAECIQVIKRALTVESELLYALRQKKPLQCKKCGIVLDIERVAAAQTLLCINCAD